MSIQLPEVKIARNIINNFFRYRGIECTSNFDNDRILADLSAGYVIIQGGNLNVVIIAEVTSLEFNKDSTVKFISKVLRSVKGKIIFIIDNYTYESKKNVTSELLLIGKVYPFKIFVLPVPYHKDVPKHEIVSKEEVDELLKTDRIHISDMPIISINDPPIVWLGGEANQIVRITETSHTAGKTILYLLIK